MIDTVFKYLALLLAYTKYDIVFFIQQLFLCDKFGLIPLDMGYLGNLFTIILSFLGGEHHILTCDESNI